MLDLAYKHASKVQEKYQNTIFDERYKFWHFREYQKYTLTLDDNSWNTIQFVSKVDDTLLGYLCANLDRNNYSASLSILNFNLDAISFTFVRDLENFIKMLFEKFNINKLDFCVVIGNPSERLYDRFVEKYNGRIVGIKQQEVVLCDNKLYDVKYYEVMRKDYLG